MSRLLVLQHIDREGPGLFLQIAKEKGLSVCIFRDLLWKATPVRPDGILNASNLWTELTKKGSNSICSFPFPELDKFCKGFRKQQMLCIAAGSGTGKSTICR